MFAEVDVFVGNNTIIDSEIYQLWLDGYSAQDAAVKLLPQESQLHECITLDLLTSDILDHFRCFQMLERHLHHPTQLAEQWTFQISPESQKLLIRKYYEFDPTVVREFLGKKLSARNRKELDEVSEKTGVDIKSCRRQFDNVKRVYKLVEDQTKPLIQNIQMNLLLPDNLARKYGAVAYMANNRFETSKRKLQYLVFEDFLHCTCQMMANWACTKPDCKYEENSMEIEREFLQELREMKSLLEREVLDEHKAAVLRIIKSKHFSERTINDLETNFKTLSRTIVNIAYGLNHSKEVKDFFVDLVEKVVEPCRNARWTYSEMQIFLETYGNIPMSADFFGGEVQLNQVWERYIKTTSSCILKMYHH